MRLIYTLLLVLFTSGLFAQKMLLIERANRAKTAKLFIGDQLIFRLEGEEDYWYKRTITDMMPESNSLILDGYLVSVDDIAGIKVHRRPIWRFLGGTTLAFGVSLVAAVGVAALDRNTNVAYVPALCIAGGNLGLSRFLLKRRKLPLDDKTRLRIVEIDFSKWKEVPEEPKEP